MMTKTLWRAADDDSISDSACFAETVETARLYLDPGFAGQAPAMGGRMVGFGGRRLYRAEVTIDPSRVLDVADVRDATGAIADVIGVRHPGAIEADDYAPRVSYEIREAGYDWVRVQECYPADTITWIFVGALNVEPEMEEV